MFVPRFLVISLGNPAPHADCLHSAGHVALNVVQRLSSAGLKSQPPFSRVRVASKTAKRSVGDPYTLLQSPCVMNVSGPWVAKAYQESLRENNLKPSELQLVLVHDDLESALGTVKVRQWKSSHRGHNGVKSVYASLRPHDYPGGRLTRLAIGIDRPVEKDYDTVADYVLRPMTGREKDALNNKAGPGVVECLHTLKEAWEKEMLEKEL